MIHQRAVLLTLLLSLGVLLSACNLEESPNNELSDNLPEGLIVVENRDGLATTALGENIAACFYEDADYGGASLCREFSDPGVTFITSTIPEEWNDRISSVELAPGVSAKMYEEAGYQGAVFEPTASSSYVGDAFNDTMSSFSVTMPAADDDTDTGEEGAFDIQLRFNGEVSDSQRAVFEAAAQKWSSIITEATGMPESVEIPEGTCFTETEGFFFEGLPAFSGTITSILIDVQLVEIDGPEGVGGQAGPCLIRTETNNLPAYGAMEFDLADVNNLEDIDVFEDLILHEMGHVLGFGSLWNFGRSLTSGAPMNSCGTNPRFIGANAVREWQALGGQDNVPLETSGGLATCNSHWSENVFGSELMSPNINPDMNSAAPLPLSRLTIASMEDLGYSVNYAAADPYQLPTNSLNTQGAEPTLDFELEHPTSVGSFEDYTTP